MLKPITLAFVISCLCISCGGGQKQQEIKKLDFQKPADCGAYNMPYIRYDSKDAQKGGGATQEEAPDFDYHKTASEASNQEYIVLHSTDDFVSWKVNESANGITLRFTLPDKADELGESAGQQSNIDIYVNNQKVKTVALTSYYSWQYFKPGISEPVITISDEVYPMMQFDEIHFLLDEALNPEDVITIKKTSNDDLTCGVDFIEIENVPAAIAKPENALSVKDFGAKGDSVSNDYDAFIACIEAANKAGKIVYVPEGKYCLNNMLKLNLDNTNIQGAGMWYTEIYFSNDNFRSGGFCGNANRIRLSDVYINGKNNRRLGLRDKDGKVVNVINYKWENRVLYQDQKGISGNFGDSSVIENVWVEHFECGIWIAPYAWVEGKENIFTTPEGFTWTNDKGKTFDVPAGIVLDTCTLTAVKDRTTNLRVSNVRLRNEYADGVNFAEGTSFSVFEHSNVRNCGDDGIASWSQRDAGHKTPANQGNKIRYNTVELGWRAGGIGIFGGGGHEISNCFVSEHSLSAGIRFTADFPGSLLDSDPNNAMKVKNCVIYKCGTPADLFNDRLGAIDIHGGWRYLLNNITFENIQIVNPQTDGIQLWGGNINNATFKNVKITGVGKDGYDIASRIDRAPRRKDNLQEIQQGSAKFENVTDDKVLNENKYFTLGFK